MHLAKEDEKYKCSRCNSSHVDLVDDNKVLICLDCGWEKEV